MHLRHKAIGYHLLTSPNMFNFEVLSCALHDRQALPSASMSCVPDRATVMAVAVAMPDLHRTRQSLRQVGGAGHNGLRNVGM